ncbi:MAG: arsenate reductase (glutaredoxin) [Gammaproteobacteria bacterium]
MPDTITIYHNPRCSKSRATLELLQAEGHQPAVIEYLSTPPDAKTLGAILDLLGLEPRDLMRTHEQEYTAAGLDNPQLGRAELIAAMIKYPRLIQRPIVVCGDQVALGRPPENVLKILQGNSD